MSRLRRAFALMLLLLLVLPGPAAASAALTEGAAVTPALLPAQVTTVLGSRFTVEAHIDNDGPLGPLIAHLNVVSLDQKAYVDPEDWSPERTREIPALAAGIGTTLSWQIQAVNAGRFAVYYVVIPVDSQRRAGSASYLVSTPTQLTVTERPTLDTGSSLWVAVAVPLFVAAVALLFRWRGRASG